MARSGDVVLELDEGLGHREETWQLSIDTPLVYVTAQFNNVSQLRNILRYLEESSGGRRATEARLGSVALIWDDERPRRLFLRMVGQRGHVRLTLDPKQSRALATALGKLIEQLVE